MGRRSIEVEVPAKASDSYKWVISEQRGGAYIDSDGNFSVLDAEGSMLPLYWLITEK
jgi:hypothetical protein